MTCGLPNRRREAGEQLAGQAEEAEPGRADQQTRPQARAPGAPLLCLACTSLRVVSFMKMKNQTRSWI